MGLRKMGMFAALLLVALVSVRCQVAKEIPTAAPASTVSVGGIYRYGNPCYSKGLYIKPNGSFHHIVWDCCTGSTHNEGTWRRNGDSIILEPTRLPSKVNYPKAEVLSFARVQDTSEAKNIVRITVVDENDKPLSEVTVSIRDGGESWEQLKTDSLGQVSFPLYLNAEVTKISLWRNNLSSGGEFPELDEVATYALTEMRYESFDFTAYHGGPNAFRVRLQPSGERSIDKRSGREALYIGDSGVLRGKNDIDYLPK